MGSADQLGGTTEFGARACRGDLGLRLPTSDERPRKGLKTGAGFNRNGFAR